MTASPAASNSPTPRAAAPSATLGEIAAVPFWRAARAVFDLSLEGMVWSGRSVLVAVLLGLPVLLALLYRVVILTRFHPNLSATTFYSILIVFYYVANMVPLAALFYATALIADEVEGKTITYLLTRPVQRGAILVGKLAAYLATTVSLTLPPALLIFFVLGTTRGWVGLGARVPDLFRDLGVLVLTLIAYGAFFTLMGIVLRRPIIPGLLFLFVWEFLVHAPGYAPRLTITAYLRSLLPYQVPEEGFMAMFRQVLPTALCLEAVGAMIVVFLAGAAWIFSQREYVLDQ